MAIQFLPQGFQAPGIGESFGTGLGSGLNTSLTYLMNQKLSELGNAKKAAALEPILANLNQGATPQEIAMMAKGIVAQDPALGGQIYKNLSSLAGGNQSANMYNQGLGLTPPTQQPPTQYTPAQQAITNTPPVGAPMGAAAAKQPVVPPTGQQAPAQGMAPATQPGQAGQPPAIAKPAPEVSPRLANLQDRLNTLRNTPAPMGKGQKATEDWIKQHKEDIYRLEKLEQEERNLDRKYEHLEKADLRKANNKVIQEWRDTKARGVKDEVLYKTLLHAAEKGEELNSPGFQQTIDKLGVSGWFTTPTQDILKKTISTLAQGANQAFGMGSRGGAFMINRYEQSIPSLYNTKEGLIAVTKIKLNEVKANKLYDAERRKIEEANGGKAPDNIQDLVYDAVEPQILALGEDSNRILDEAINPQPKAPTKQMFKTMPDAKGNENMDLFDKQSNQWFHSNGITWLPGKGG